MPSQVALTLRAVGGLTTAEIARGFLVPEATIAQRISRAKQRIKETGAQFQMPPSHERSVRTDAVLRVLVPRLQRRPHRERGTGALPAAISRRKQSDLRAKCARRCRMTAKWLGYWP